MPTPINNSSDDDNSAGASAGGNAGGGSDGNSASAGGQGQSGGKGGAANAGGAGGTIRAQAGAGGSAGSAGGSSHTGGAGQGGAAGTVAAGHGGQGSVVTGGMSGSAGAAGNAVDLFAYDSFNYPAASYSADGGNRVDTLNGGKGWSQAWDFGENAPKFATTSAKPLTVPPLRSDPGYMMHDNAESGRKLDVSGAFGAYALPGGSDEGPNIGANGTSLWMSVLLRADESNPTRPVFVTTHKDTAFGYHLYAAVWAVGVDPANSQAWSLFTGGYPYSGNNNPPTAHRSNISMTPGEAALLVVRFDFAAGTDHISLWVNPKLGGDPGAANAEGDVSDLQFKQFGWSAESSAASLDEVRFGGSFAAVTPTSP